MSEREHHLILRYLEGSQTPEEKREFELWMTTSPGNPAMVESYRKIWEASRDNVKHAFDSKVGWAEFASAVNLETETPRRSFPVMRLAAAVIALLVVSYVVYLMFFNGNQVELRAGETPVQATLPDGSQVWLNENTTLSYNHRVVELNGEAFFDVVKDDGNPFVINAGKSTVKVLGTSFNVNARVKDSVLVYVVTGIVSLSMDKTLQLTAGQRAIATVGETQLIESDPNDVAWKTKQLVFSKESLDNVARRLRSYFKKEVRISNEQLRACRFTGSFDDPTLDEVFETLSFALDIKVARENNGYLITGNGCKSN